MAGPEAPLVSVITIFFNAERFLAEAIASVRAQTHPHWELLLVDDGSTDASAALARAAAAADPARIRVLAHPDGTNHGMSAARNLGLAHARGELLALLDADDVYHPEKLARQVALLHAHPRAGFVYGNTEYWYSWTRRPEDQGRDRVRRRRLEAGRLIEPPTLVGRFLRDTARTPPTCGVLMRREAVERTGGFEESFRGLYEDQVFFYKLCATAAVYVDDGCYERYRQHEHSAVHRALARGEWTRERSAAPARRKFLDWVARFLDDQGVDDPWLRAVLWRERLPFTRPWLDRALTLAAWPAAIVSRVGAALRARVGAVRVGALRVDA